MQPFPTTDIAKTIINIAAYKFFRWDQLESRRDEMKSLCKRLALRGTVMISGEGINLFLAGSRDSIDTFLAHLRGIPELVDMPIKESTTDFQPFNRMLVKIKREIIPVGIEDVQTVEDASPKIAPEVLKQWLDEKKSLTLLDTRNDYEVELGTFENAIDLNLKTFREFPKAAASLPDELKKKPVVMFCTGGIRCEKIGPYMKGLGFNEIYQLDGGILKYLEKCNQSHYTGNCFVFDQRVAIDATLDPSDTKECFVCRHALSSDDLLSDNYIPSISCPYCYKTPEERQKFALTKRHATIQKIASEQRGTIPYENKRWISIPQRSSGKPLIDALCDFYPGYSREQWQTAIETGEVQSPIAIKESLHSRPVRADQIVREGERFLQRLQNYVEPPVNPNIELVYEDAAIVVVNKSAPLPMHPSGRFNLNTLEAILDASFYPDKLRSAHRLDANTTGLVVYARKYAYSQFLQSQFTDGTVEKVYLATVDGRPIWDEIECNLAISKEPASNGGRCIDPDGLPSLTRFVVCRRMDNNTTHIEARPATGRTHQIRLHLASLGFPIVNDPLYQIDGSARKSPDEYRQTKAMGLHAQRLSFVHPISRERVCFERSQPLPETLH